MNRLKVAIEELEEANREAVAAANAIVAENRITIGLEESRNLRDRLCDASVLTARAERAVLEIPIKN